MIVLYCVRAEGRIASVGVGVRLAVDISAQPLRRMKRLEESWSFHMIVFRLHLLIISPYIAYVHTRYICLCSSSTSPSIKKCVYVCVWLYELWESVWESESV